MTTQKMSLDEATKVFGQLLLRGKTARQEAMRGTFDPVISIIPWANADFEVSRTINKAQQATISLQKFHNELLNHGMPPFVSSRNHA